MKLSFSRFLSKLGLGTMDPQNQATTKLKARAAIARAEQIKKLHRGV